MNFVVGLLSVSLSAFTFSSAAKASDAAFSARVEAVNGTLLSAERAGKFVPLKTGDSLKPGDELKTGIDTAADIRVNGNLIRLGINTSYRIENTDNWHRLQKGIVRILVPEKKSTKPEIRFRLRTSEGTIGVRGTEFVVDRRKEETRLKGLKGQVLLGPANADFSEEAKFVLVMKGYESVLTPKSQRASNPESFPLEKYLEEIRDGKGSFGPLAYRESGMVQKRGAAPNVNKAETSLGVGVAPKAVKETKIQAPKEDKTMNALELLLESAIVADIDLLKKALEKGAKVDMAFPKYSDSTALHVAAVSDEVKSMAKRLEYLQQLLEIDETLLERKNASGQNAIALLAREGGQVEVAKLLLQNAVEAKNLKRVRALLSEKDKNGDNALTLAKEHKREDLLEEFAIYLE